MSAQERQSSRVAEIVGRQSLTHLRHHRAIFACCTAAFFRNGVVICGPKPGGVRMRRRAFITLLGGAAAMWPFAVRAQEGERMRRLGVLMNGNESDPIFRAYAAAFVQMLQRLGWREGQNLRIDLRWPGADPENIGAHAADLVGLTPDV